MGVFSEQAPYKGKNYYENLWKTRSNIKFVILLKTYLTFADENMRDKTK